MDSNSAGTPRLPIGDRLKFRTVEPAYHN